MRSPPIVYGKYLISTMQKNMVNIFRRSQKTTFVSDNFDPMIYPLYDAKGVITLVKIEIKIEFD